MLDCPFILNPTSASLAIEWRGCPPPGVGHHARGGRHSVFPGELPPGGRDHLRRMPGSLSSHQDFELCARHPTQGRNFLARSRAGWLQMISTTNPTSPIPINCTASATESYSSQYRLPEGMMSNPVSNARLFLDARIEGVRTAIIDEFVLDALAKEPDCNLCWARGAR